ncbi:unnamed protein product [Bemisia tabaci]|uniref:Ionotropic receptor n=1 Tax=Bemisia tabaci TaxID=7038 RepID=A0A9P0A4E3_BEMTA|nr:unnamed protein product [Bemisia tabaci]
MAVPETSPRGLSENVVSYLHDSGSLLFCFKFFWRFFKGRRVVICFPNDCAKYDAFTEDLISYRNHPHETFFDFSWKNMHGKPIVSTLGFMQNPGLKVSNRPLWSNYGGFYEELVSHFERSVNCTLKLIPTVDENLAIENSLKHGIELPLFEIGTFLKGTDVSKFDFSLSFDTSSICIATPHSGFMSQSLVIFKSYSPVVWVFICVTIITFVSMQYVFQYSQCELFHRLYTDADIDYLRDNSALLTVYAYFTCGSPPSLHLGHFFTGKILFVIFSFSAIIISTVFLSGMTTLLSEKVMYPEIDSLEALEKSELFVQSFERFDDNMLSFLAELNQSKALEAKFIDSMIFYVDLFYVELVATSHYINANDTLMSFESNFQNLTEKVENNIISIAETDAVLLSIPYSSTPRTDLRIRHYVLEDGWFEYHLMKESLMTCVSTSSLSFLNLLHLKKVCSGVSTDPQNGQSGDSLRLNLFKYCPKAPCLHERLPSKRWAQSWFSSPEDD